MPVTHKEDLLRVLAGITTGQIRGMVLIWQETGDALCETSEIENDPTVYRAIIAQLEVAKTRLISKYMEHHQINNSVLIPAPVTKDAN